MTVVTQTFKNESFNGETSLGIIVADVSLEGETSLWEPSPLDGVVPEKDLKEIKAWVWSLAASI